MYVFLFLYAFQDVANLKISSGSVELFCKKALKFDKQLLYHCLVYLQHQKKVRQNLHFDAPFLSMMFPNYYLQPQLRRDVKHAVD